MTPLVTPEQQQDQLAKRARATGFPPVRINGFIVRGKADYENALARSREWPPYLAADVLAQLDAAERARRTGLTTRETRGEEMTVRSVEDSLAMEDEDRERRLRLARANREATAGRRRLTVRPAWPDDEEKARAVRTGLEKFMGLGRFSFLSSHVMPAFDVTFDDPTMPADCAATCRFYQDGSIVILLRSTRTPEQLHRDVLHECQHAHDAPLVRRHFCRKRLEERARLAEERLAALPW
jgi:hypothetical protein